MFLLSYIFVNVGNLEKPFPVSLGQLCPPAWRPFSPMNPIMQLREGAHRVLWIEFRSFAHSL